MQDSSQCIAGAPSMPCKLPLIGIDLLTWILKSASVMLAIDQCSWPATTRGLAAEFMILLANLKVVTNIICFHIVPLHVLFIVSMYWAKAVAVVM